jgi:hypothetical protein
MPKSFKSVEERRAYWREWYSRNKHREDYKEKHLETKSRIMKEKGKWWTEFKKTLKCKNCLNDDFRVLEFHHRDSSTKFDNVSRLAKTNYGKKKILEEVSKCDVLCANCHRILHYELRNKDIQI